MAFREVRFPAIMTYGGAWGPMWASAQSESPSARRQSEVATTIARGVYQVGLANRTEAETRSLLAFFHAIAQGRAHGFRFLDLNPGESSGLNEPLGTGTGAQTAYQLVKRYTSGALTYDRVITKPVAGTLTITINGTPSTAWTLNSATGVVTFSSPPAGGAVLVATGFRYDVPARFDVDELRLTTVEPGIYSWPSITLKALRERASV